MTELEQQVLNKLQENSLSQTAIAQLLECSQQYVSKIARKHGLSTSRTRRKQVTTTPVTTTLPLDRELEEELGDLITTTPLTTITTTFTTNLEAINALQFLKEKLQHLKDHRTFVSKRLFEELMKYLEIIQEAL